jgi:hypothetical protein
MILNIYEMSLHNVMLSITTTCLKTQHNGTGLYDDLNNGTAYGHSKMILKIYKMSLRNVTLSITTTSLKTQQNGTQLYNSLNNNTQDTGTQK